MRYLGIDFGLKRVGLALTDPSGTMAFPYKTLHRTTRRQFFEDLLAVMDQEKVEGVVLGLPLDLEGRETETTRQVINFKNSLARRTDLPIYLVNEALSSFEAEQTLTSTGMKKKKQKPVLDQMAAIIILESFLASR
ncbi:MAG TPA: Holliday junction resolvase RuvX [Desulfomicrobiaceae bacterium]|nr:Holliday junction resolvase RuvX [Desulfomicrobiaceae bacterium]